MVINGQKGFIVGTMGSWNLYENETNFWIKGVNTDCKWYWRTLHEPKSRMQDWYVNDHFCLTGNNHYSIALGYMHMLGTAPTNDNAGLI